LSIKGAKNFPPHFVFDLKPRSQFRPVLLAKNQRELSNNEVRNPHSLYGTL